MVRALLRHWDMRTQPPGHLTLISSTRSKTRSASNSDVSLLELSCSSLTCPQKAHLLRLILRLNDLGRRDTRKADLALRIGDIVLRLLGV